MKHWFKGCALVALLVLLAAAMTAAAVPALAEADVTAVETPAAAPKPTAVRLSASGTVKLAIDAQLTLTPALTPENAQTTYSWKTSDKKVATVSGGVVTPKKVGTATITVTTANKKTSSVKVKVYDPYLPTSVKLDRTGTVKVPIGDKLTLTPTLAPETAQSTYKWSTSKKSVATVSGGVVTAKKVGTATITVKTRNGKKAKVKVKVYDPYIPTSVKFEQSGTQTVMATNTLQLNAVLYPETAQSALKWKSSKKKVASVNAQGLVTAIAPGTATITVTTRNKKTAKIKIKVMDDGNQPITTAADYNLPYVIYACKNSHTIAILARDDNGEWTRVIRTFPTGTGRNNTTDVGIFFISKKERWHKWGSSSYSPYANKLSVGIFIHGPIYKAKNANTMRASYYNVIGKDCSSGCLRTVSGCAAWVYYNCPVGTQVIVAQNSRFSAPKPAKVSSKTTTDPTDPGANPEVLVTGFSVAPGPLEMAQGATQALTVGDIYPANATTAGFTYATSDAAVATVSASGVVTAVSPGSAVIRVTAKDDFKCTAQVPVTVGEAANAAKLGEAASVEIPEDVIVEETPAESVEGPVEEPEPVEESAEGPAAEAPDEAPAEEPAVEAGETGVETASEAAEADAAGTPEGDTEAFEDAFTLEEEAVDPETEEMLIEME